MLRIPTLAVRNCSSKLVRGLVSAPNGSRASQQHQIQDTAAVPPCFQEGTIFLRSLGGLPFDKKVLQKDLDLCSKLRELSLTSCHSMGVGRLFDKRNILTGTILGKVTSGFALTTHSSTLPLPVALGTSMLGGVRSITYYSRLKGKKKTCRAVIRRFYRLEWGAWIRPRSGRHRKVWRKNSRMRKRALTHVFCNTTQSHMLDKMVCRYWRDKRYYVDDPYESYHKRENFHLTRKWP